MKPKVTIIMATYNRAHFIVETLQSIQEQTFIDWECLIIDDGGLDNTLTVVAPVLEKDKRFKYLKRPVNFKKGIAGCRNYGIHIAIGDFIVFFDDDDIVHPENLKTCLTILENDSVDFCHYQKTPFIIIKPTIKKFATLKQRDLSIADVEKVVTEQIGLASCTVMWRKYCFTEIRFNESLLYAEEWECYSRLITENYKGIIIDAVLYYNRKHADSNTGEFFNQNPVRRESKKNAIILVLNNLKDKRLLTFSLKRYFIQVSLSFKEFNLFKQIIDSLELSAVEKIQWRVFYILLPLRLSVYKIKKIIIKKIIIKK
jgi:glycosyltransferase involved in cell wall biosynthesis